MSSNDIALQERPEPEGSNCAAPTLQVVPDDSATGDVVTDPKIYSGSRSAKLTSTNKGIKGCLNVRKNSVLRRGERNRRESHLMEAAISGRRQSVSANQRQQVSFSEKARDVSDNSGESRQTAPKSSLRTRRMTWTGAQILTPKKSNESNVRRSSMANKGVKPVDPNVDPVTGLSRQQIKAFKEVFDLFDCNGGGTIDAEDLDGALRSVQICLTKAEIKEVLHTMDQDGTGQVDFNEFLQMMTNTERFIEMLERNKNEKDTGPKDSETKAQNHHLLLFEALTAFMKKCALKSMEAIVGYYHNKYQKSQASGYVNHYAAGERLIGLTEKQLKEHLESLVKATPKTKGKKSLSPYAQPLNIVILKNPNTRRSNKTRMRGRIRLKVRHTDSAVKSSHDSTASSNKSLRQPPKIVHHNDPINEVGWVSQRTEHIEVKLPYQFLKPFEPFDELTAEDLPAIRGQVNDAFREYTLQRRHAQVHDGIQHWVALEPELISPKSLRKNFRVVFSTYTDIDTCYLPLHSTQI